MGQELSHSHFSKAESITFADRLQQETRLLRQKMEGGEFSSHAPVGGFEVEAWLVDSSLRPAPVNQVFFDRLNNPMATPELAKFNIELNNTPLSLTENCFQQFENELNTVFEEAVKVAQAIDTDVLLTGILPTVQASDFCLANMSEMKRYKALNETILKARDFKPLKLDIKGKDHLQLTKHSVMMEAATTSFQIHLQTPWKQAHHYYNASIIASAPLMAVSGNSPFLFGKQLWHETRIPLFEQAVDTGNGSKRVSFGNGYAESSICECFEENLRDYPVLLPMLFEDKADAFSHLRLHNGVVWRWNRPLIGFDSDSTPHIRIEQRILPAGPTITDMMANAVFFYGLTESIMKDITIHGKMPFEQAKDNFYQAAQNGLGATMKWGGGTHEGSELQQLILDDLIPQATHDLKDLGISESAIDHYLGIIADRTKSGQTGAVWQINHLKNVDGDFTQLTDDYLHHQQTGQPIHTWTV